MAENTDGIERAFFKKKGEKDEKKIEVHFNPEALEYTISNTLKDKGRGNKKKQYVKESSGKLTMEILFDTTDTGADVRINTNSIAKFMEPDSEKVPPIVVFEWGMYSFQGMLESYKESIDFFSSDGVPLRASLNLTLSSQDDVFESDVSDGSSVTGDGLNPTTSLPVNSPPGKGATEIATQGGDPSAARSLAAANGLENMRFAGDTPLEVSEEIELRGPEVFATGELNLGGGAGLNIGGAAGLGGGAGLDIGASAGLDLDAGAALGTTLGNANVNASASVGGNLSAGVSANAGAFAKLKTGTASSSSKLNLGAFSADTGTAALGLEASASIGLGGSAAISGSASMKADVGKAGDLQARIAFDGG